MIKRLFSLVVAFAVAGAPVALEACQLACATSSGPSMDGHAAHHDHGGQQTTARPCHESPSAPCHLTSQASPCDHDDEAIVPSVTAIRTADVLLLRAAAVPPIAEGVFVATATFVPTRHSTLPDRFEIRLSAPLRI